MNARITPSALRGIVTAPHSKSYAQRYLIASHLSGERILPSFPDAGDDVRATYEALEALRLGQRRIDCKNSGTTARILAQVIAVTAPHAELAVSEQLSKRPLQTLISQPPRAGLYRVVGDTSSQYLSGLLFALPLLDGDSRLEMTTPLESSGYVAITIEVLRQFGITIWGNEHDGWDVSGNQVYRAPASIVCEGDWSSAPVWLGAGAGVIGLNPHTIQPDGIAFLPFCAFSEGVCTLDYSIPFPDHFDVSQNPDLTPLLAVLSAVRLGATVFTGIRRLKIKESDRIASILALVADLGGSARREGESLVVEGTGKLCGGVVDAFGDHRIVMGATLASCFCTNPVTILGADAVSKSYSRFFDDFVALGGHVEFE